MLDREEDAALAEIEAALRRDDPDFVERLERLDRDPLGIADRLGAAPLIETPALQELEALAAEPFEPFEPPVGRTRRQAFLLVLSVVGAVLLALVVTLAVTAAWGPDAGGLAGVVSIMAATVYGYQALRGCPGRR